MRMKTNRISDAQYKFLRDVRDDAKTLGQLTAEHKLESKRFSRWMRGVGFRRALTEAMRTSKRQRRLALRLAANVAAAVMADAVRNRTALAQPLQALLERAINQGRKEEQAARAEQRAQARGRGARGAFGRGKRVSPDDDLCHPSAKAEEDELLAILAAANAEP